MDMVGEQIRTGIPRRRHRVQAGPSARRNSCDSLPQERQGVAASARDSPATGELARRHDPCSAVGGMRCIVVVAGLLATFVFAPESDAQSGYLAGARSRVGGRRADCPLSTCGLPTFGVVIGGGASVYVGAWARRKGDLAVMTHVAGTLVGVLTTTTAILYAATNDPAPPYQTFGTVACLAVGLPALVLGLHGLISADAKREQEKPGPVPNWYGPSIMRVHGGPAAIADARGALSPGVTLGGAF